MDWQICEKDDCFFVQPSGSNCVRGSTPRDGCSVMASLAKRVAQPFETFVKTIARSSAGGLDVLMMCQPISHLLRIDCHSYPGPLSETVETKLVGNFGSVHGILQLIST